MIWTQPNQPGICNIPIRRGDRESVISDHWNGGARSRLRCGCRSGRLRLQCSRRLLPWSDALPSGSLGGRRCGRLHLRGTCYSSRPVRMPWSAGWRWRRLCRLLLCRSCRLRGGRVWHGCGFRRLGVLHARNPNPLDLIGCLATQHAAVPKR